MIEFVLRSLMFSCVIMGLWGPRVLCLQDLTGLGHGQKDEFNHGITNEGDIFADSALLLGDRLVNGQLPLSNKNELPFQKGETTAHDVEFNDDLFQSVDNTGNVIVNIADHALYTFKSEPETDENGKPIESEIKANY